MAKHRTWLLLPISRCDTPRGLRKADPRLAPSRPPCSPEPGVLCPAQAGPCGSSPWGSSGHLPTSAGFAVMVPSALPLGPALSAVGALVEVDVLVGLTNQNQSKPSVERTQENVTAVLGFLEFMPLTVQLQGPLRGAPSPRHSPPCAHAPCLSYSQGSGLRRCPRRCCTQRCGSASVGLHPGLLPELGPGRKQNSPSSAGGFIQSEGSRVWLHSWLSRGSSWSQAGVLRVASKVP